MPSALVFVVLALAAFRLTRLVGWDDLPPVLRVRAWLVGERWVPDDDAELPGKTPESEVAHVRPAYDRPQLAHFIHCPWCVGAWICLAVYVAWVLVPTATLYVAVPLALSSVVGLVAKNLDP